jgi:N-acetyl-anhydromuramyl-L-alanine amidase AmpD
MSRDEQQSMREAMDAAGASLREALSSAEYPAASWSPSPNFTPGRDRPVDRVVIHITDGQPLTHRAVAHLQKTRAEYEAQGRDASPVSAHFLIGQAGEVVQLVRLCDTAWHATSWNAHSIGIEHVARTPGEHGPDDPGLPLTAEQLAASAALVRWLCARFGLPIDEHHVLPHCAHPRTTHRDCGRDEEQGGIWPWSRYWQLLEGAR